MNLIDVISEFKVCIDRITAVFLDARDGFHLLQTRLSEQENWDAPIYYGDGPPGKVDTVVHTTTIAQRIGRNACDGENCTFISNMAVVAIYAYWEDHYRVMIAEALGLEKNELKSDVFRDIGWLRNSIVHRREVASKNVAKCKVLTPFSENDEIFLSEPRYLQMIGEIHEYLAGLASETNDIAINKG